MIKKSAIQAEREFYTRLQSQYRKKLSRAPEGSISFRYDHRKWRPYVRKGEKDIYLKKKECGLLIHQLMEKKLLQQAMRRIENNLKLLELLDKKYIDYDDIAFDALAEELDQKKGNGFKTESFLKDPAVINRQQQEIDDWLADRGPTNPYRPEKLEHITLSGVKVRTKSELLIATFLELKGVPYKYEEQLIVEGNEWYPDFKVMRRSDGKVLIWEHLGMMDDEDYAARTQHRMMVYAMNGYHAYKNLIVTYDDHGTIDMTVLDRIYELMLK